MRKAGSYCCSGKHQNPHGSKNHTDKFLLIFKKAVCVFDPCVLKRKTILVVDDDRSMRKGPAYQLTDLGYEVAEASDGVQAIELTKKKHFDLVISDLVMPKADGLHVYDAIQGIKSSTKIMIITAFSDSKKAKDATRILRRNFILRPF
ncbi:MAG: response regulator [bacterium]